ncbi:MAG: CDP-alcohol phosphatidyltransferase family protein [Prevotella sp.]|nr:CDP-alcohol phosphatidyltransferase family protein [Prevotella sp.]
MEDNRTFKELLQASFKSEDTEEWLDVWFTRPIGLAFALLWRRLGVHPNTITILSIFLGMGAGAMFYFSDFWHNLAGIILLMFANFCDSTDGQLARLTGQKTMIGRMLDGFAGDVWFFCIYLAILLRLWHQPIPFTDDIEWGIGAFVLCAVASLLCHSPQSSLADYYRQIHLFFLSGKDGSEFSTWKQNKDYYDSLPKEARLDRAFYYNYCNYCKSQERRTPAFQRFMSLWTTEAIDNEQREQIRQEFLYGRRPLMKYTNILTFNTRAICLYVSCLADVPWLYPVIEITVFSVLYVYMKYSHESLSALMAKKIQEKK